MTKTAIIDSMKYNPISPDNIRLYHGTTHDGSCIPLEGFMYTGTSIWNCSDEEQVYFYELNKFCEVEGLEEDSFCEQQSRILERANESGQLAEAVLKDPKKNTYVFELVVPKEFEQFIFPDESCPNMAECGAVQVDRELINYLMEADKCTVNVYSFNFIPKMSYLYLLSMLNNPYFIGFDEFTSDEMTIIETMSDRGIFVEELFYDCFKEFVIYYGPLDPNHYSE